MEREGQAAQHARVDKLWRELDTQKEGQLDLDGLKKGLSKLNHRRNFLLFIPANDPNLRAVFSYYSSTLTVNPEGDVHIADAEGLGKHDFPRTVFGALFDIFNPPKPQLTPRPSVKQPAMPLKEVKTLQAAVTLSPDQFPFDPGDQYPQYEDYIPHEVFAPYQHHKVITLTDFLPSPGYFIAGGIAGAISRTATAPLDRLKVYLIAQVGVKDDAISHAKSGAPVKAAKTATRPLVEAVKTLWRMGGMRSLFAVKGGERGNALIITTARKMWASSGLYSFYRGLPMGLIGMFPYAGIDLTTYEYLSRYLKSRKARLNNTDEADTNLSGFTTAAIGGFCGTLGASTVYPINLLRTRLQSQGTAIHPPTYTGAWDVTMRTIQGEGFRGLFKGITPNLLKVVPAVSITYVVYDKSKQFLGLK
ncbi:hypothetical protein P7C71_g1434, partial [Lecanoromycetidae sp. Uapishka_2]